MKTIHRTIVAAILISKDDKVLLGKQRAGGVYPDCWHIPGGGGDKGETNEQALVREVQEEVGIDISSCQKHLVSDSDTGTAEKTDKVTGEKFIAAMQFNTFQVQLSQKAEDIHLELKDDLVESKWVAICDLKNYKHTPPSLKHFIRLGFINPIRVAGCIVINEADQMLIIHRQKNGKDQWETPGGKVEPGETDEAAAIRELYEEIGQRVYIQSKLGEADFFENNTYYHYIWFKAKLSSPTINLESGFVDYKFISLSDIKTTSLPLSTGTQKFLEITSLPNL